MSSAHILVVEDSETTLLKLKFVLVYFGYRVTTHSDAQTALDWLAVTQQAPDLILSDVLMPGLSGIEFTEKVRAMPAFGKIPIVLLTADPDAEAEQAGRRAGANKYLNKLLSAAELTDQIKALLDSQIPPAPQAVPLLQRMITVFSLRGGVGTTSLAVNLAIGLKQLWGGEVTLWDMALSSGHCGLMLGLDPEPPAHPWTLGLGEAHPASDLLVGHASGIKVIPTPAGLARTRLPAREAVEAVWQAVRGQNDYLVIDGGSHFTDPLQPLLQAADQILLLLGPDSASQKSGVDALEGLRELGVALEKCALVLNHPYRQAPANKTPFETPLGKSPLMEIPYDGQSFSRAVASADPLLNAASTSESAQALLLLAYRVSKQEMEARVGEVSNPLLHKARQLEWESDVGLLKW